MIFSQSNHCVEGKKKSQLTVQYFSILEKSPFSDPVALRKVNSLCSSSTSWSLTPVEKAFCCVQPKFLS